MKIIITQRSDGKFGVIVGGILRTVKATRKGAVGVANKIVEANPEMKIVQPGGPRK